MGLAGKCKRPEMRFRKNHYHFILPEGRPKSYQYFRMSLRIEIIGPHLNLKVKYLKSIKFLSKLPPTLLKFYINLYNF